ncbi:MAG: HTTM domain-containing protein [Planctomycetota bacterium]
MTTRAITRVGISPRLPGWLGRSTWWNVPIPAEPVAALRILVAMVLLLDQLGTIWPQFSSLFGLGSTGDPEFFAWFCNGSSSHWSVLNGIGDLSVLRLAFGVWCVATFAMMIGWNTRLATVIVWVLSVSFNNLNLYSINAGDHIRSIILMYLMLTPCAAVWSIDALVRRRGSDSLRVVVHPWGMRLLMIQFAWMYGTSGLCKLSGQCWPAGESLYYIMNDLSVTRFSSQAFPVPFLLTRLCTWSVLAWEVLFPVLICFPNLRRPTLWFGFAMHLNIFLTMDLGCFPLYVLAAYVPLIWCSHSGEVQSRILAFARKRCRSFLSSASCSVMSRNDSALLLEHRKKPQCLRPE